MKKILKITGILCIAVMSVTMYFNVETNKTQNLDLASLIAYNVANAEVILNGCRNEENHSCMNGTVTVTGCDESTWLQRDNCPYNP